MSANTADHLLESSHPLGATVAARWRTTGAAYIAVTKPRIMTLLLLTTIAALAVAAREHPLPAPALLRVLLATTVGGALASGGASALNCYIDRDIDLLMARTKRRPIPAGTLMPAQVLRFGLMLSALSLLVLLAFTTPLAALFALLGNIFYVGMYTMWLKRRTTQNIVLGGVAGAIPPLVGWAAVTGGIALAPVLMLVLIVLWTPAHFWALALTLRRDYTRAGVPMLPSVANQRHVALQILMYTLLTVAAALALYAAGAMGLLYLAAATLLGLWFVQRALRLLQRPDSPKHARALFMCSNYYLAALFMAMVMDRLVVR